jgi:ketosteroid isomerase-like protein
VASRNEELVREIVEKWNAGDPAALLERVDPDTELHSRLGSIRGRPYTGLDGFQEWLSDIREHFSDFRIVVEEMREVKPGRVFATGQVEFRGAGSDLPWTQETAWLLDIDGERLRQMRIFTDQEEGRRAAEQ